MSEKNITAPAPVEGDDTLREIRIDPIIPNESVLIATARGLRPKKKEDAVERDQRVHVDRCPFCRGNEGKTPPAMASWSLQRGQQEGEQDDWEVRIVENLYPVLGDDHNEQAYSFGLQQTIEGYGRHEVIIDHDNHGITLGEMSEAHIAQLFSAYQTRMQTLYDRDPRLKYVLIFKNYGQAAGSSIPHTHSQLIATPVIPENVYREVTHSKEFHDKRGRCVFCSLIDEALTFETKIYDRDSGEVLRKIDVGQYIVERGEKFVAIKPFASRFEWEVHILPLQHEADFLNATAEDLADFSAVLKRTMARLDAVIGNVQYNYFIHSIPHSDEFDSHGASYHWHLEITPRTSIPTGFELGSGFFVNTVSPEDAVEQLRAVEV